MEINNMLMLNVGHARHDADWNFADINSPFTRIYYVTQGTAQVSIYGSEHTLRPGHLYIIPAFTPHSDRCDSLFHHFYVHIYEDVRAGNDDIMGSYDFPFEIPGDRLDRILFETLCEHNRAMALRFPDPKLYDNKHSLITCVRLNRERPLYDRLESMGIVYRLLGRFIRQATPRYITSDPRISSALRSINAREADNPGIRVDDLARAACMSTDHFIRLFRQDVGLTPMQYLIDRRMMKARLMLASESMSIKEIAYRLGYDDISYFARVFRKHVGITPRSYRNDFNK